MSITESVLKDIAECAKIGMYKPAKAAKMKAYVESNPAEIVEYYQGGMRVSEIGDLVASLC